MWIISLFVSQVLGRFEGPAAHPRQLLDRRQQGTATVTASRAAVTSWTPSPEFFYCDKAIRTVLDAWPPPNFPPLALEWDFTTYAHSVMTESYYSSMRLQDQCNVRLTAFPAEGTDEPVVSAYASASSIWRAWAESVHQEVWETLSPKCISVYPSELANALLIAATNMDECTTAVQVALGSGPTTGTAAVGVAATATTATNTNADTGAGVASTSSTGGGARETGFAGAAALVGVLGVHWII